MQNKNQNQRSAGLFYPPNPSKTPYKSITVVFITGLTLLNGYNPVLVIMEDFLNTVFLEEKKTFTSKDLPNIFISRVFVLFVTLTKVFSNRRTVFTSRFWNQFSILIQSI